MHKDATSLRNANGSNWPHTRVQRRFEIIDDEYSPEAEVDTEMPQPIGKCFQREEKEHGGIFFSGKSTTPCLAEVEFDKVYQNFERDEAFPIIHPASIVRRA
ncbi:hypothetical protein EVAR_99779_1 [Eumeta japonica]|uniref:Uncharacterized protein n=1 Tax=Eumeta variegata TaxID=151549 RepID=A0A4C1ZHM6_EUMVA|nr:hypothetical protein EVAR_99779_1 [Eumeta japonica]